MHLIYSVIKKRPSCFISHWKLSKEKESVFFKKFCRPCYDDNKKGDFFQKETDILCCESHHTITKSILFFFYTIPLIKT